jgi:uncharacterized RDD family membrane protein YckC
MESPSPYNSSLTTHVKADPGQRFLAALIDGFLFAIPVYLFTTMGLSGLVPLLNVASIAYAFTKDALPPVSGFLGGQSVGKKLMNIKVIKETTGQGLVGDYGTAAVRVVSLIIPLFNIVDMLMVFGDERKRFGDKWANTIVVKA